MDITGSSNTEGHGYITIWYTSNDIRANKNIELGQYELADVENVGNYENQAILMAIMHVRNNTSELVSFDLGDGNKTKYGLTTVENAILNAGKKLKETNYAISTNEYSILTLNSNNGSNEKNKNI